MTAATITRPALGLWRAARIAWLRYRVREARRDAAYEATSLWPREDQIRAWRKDAAAWECEILALGGEL
jgi:hypothetical protein